MKKIDIEKINNELDCDAVKSIEREQSLIKNPNVIEYWTSKTNKNLKTIHNTFYEEYNKCRKSDHSELYTSELVSFIILYEGFIDCVIKVNAAFHYQYENYEDEEIIGIYTTNNVHRPTKEEFNSLITYTQIHLNRLQHQCNQLIYKKQHKEYKRSFLTAIIVAIFSAIFSIGSICYTVYYGRGYLFYPSINSSETLENKENCCPKDITPTQNAQEYTDANSDKKSINQLDTTSFK